MTHLVSNTLRHAAVTEQDTCIGPWCFQYDLRPPNTLKLRQAMIMNIMLYKDPKFDIFITLSLRDACFTMS